jgi:hypothetical protein
MSISQADKDSIKEAFRKALSKTKSRGKTT